MKNKSKILEEIRKIRLTNDKKYPNHKDYVQHLKEIESRVVKPPSRGSNNAHTKSGKKVK